VEIILTNVEGIVMRKYGPNTIASLPEKRLIEGRVICLLPDLFLFPNYAGINISVQMKAQGVYQLETNVFSLNNLSSLYFWQTGKYLHLCPTRSSGKHNLVFNKSVFTF
jgi:hypothetical protein